MIYMASTSNNAGVTLYRDYYDLNNLYDTISCISECKVCKDIKGLNDYIRRYVMIYGIHTRE